MKFSDWTILQYEYETNTVKFYDHETSSWPDNIIFRQEIWQIIITQFYTNKCHVIIILNVSPFLVELYNFRPVHPWSITKVYRYNMYSLNGNSSKLCMLTFNHLKICNSLQQFHPTIFEGVFPLFHLDYLIKKFVLVTPIS
jgi:hypothetical protein